MGGEKKQIITISEPECGAKPTIYAALLKHVNKSALKRHVANGLKEADVEIGDEELADVVDSLYDDDYAWYDERFLIEVTQLDEA